MKAHLSGQVAADVAQQLAEPLRTLRDRLGLIVDHLERHVATSSGPAPYPWRSLQVLRQDLGGVYLEATTLARRLDELEHALVEQAPGWFELPAAVEQGLRLAHHHVAAELELMIDLGATPHVQGAPGLVALVIAQLVATCADSARGLEGSTLSIRTARDADPAYALVSVIDNGIGSDRAVALGELVRSIVEPWGGTIDATSVPRVGCAFELRFVVSDDHRPAV